jgi:predicted metalloenzyme YecM
MTVGRVMSHINTVMPGESRVSTACWITRVDHQKSWMLAFGKHDVLRG